METLKITQYAPRVRVYKMLKFDIIQKNMKKRKRRMIVF